jgi:hypothetical protein
VLAVAGCVTAPVPARVDDSDGSSDATGNDGPGAMSATERATTLLTGRFDSSAQAATDTRFYAVQLRTCRIDVPALGEHVLYVEQAMLTAVDQPYRQRVYAVAGRDDGAVVSTVYEFVTPADFVGFCGLDAGDQARLMPRASDVTELPGCAVTLVPQDDDFSGSTEGTTCLNDHNGATYATSEVTLTGAGIESWDRGYDASGAQVWGAVAGPYRFDRKE